MVLFKTQISFIDHLPEFLGAILANCTLVTPPFNQLKENILSVIDFLQVHEKIYDYNVLSPFLLRMSENEFDHSFLVSF